MNGVSVATYIELGLVQLGLRFLLLQPVVQLCEADHRYWQVLVRVGVIQYRLAPN